MGQEFQLPAAFQGQRMAQAFGASLNAQDDNLSEGIGQSYAVVGYKGKTWSLRYRGKKHDILRPDDGTPSSYLDVIILQQARHKSKSYYPDYKADSTDRPTCASMDGVVPDLDVTLKQCDSCALCPRNVWKVDPNTGRKGRECTDYKRLAVLILPTQTKPILGEPLLEPVFLRVPPASLNSLAIMGETMAAQGYHYSSYITRITFDPAKAWPEMVFRPLQGLTDQEAPVVLEMRNEPLAGRITGGEISAVGLGAVQRALQAPGAQATGLTYSPTEKSQASVAAMTADTSLQPGTTVAPPATPSTPTREAPAPSTSNGLVATGFGGAMPVAAPQGSAQPSTTQLQSQPETASATTVSGAGEPEESDAALDARIAALIGAK